MILASDVSLVDQCQMLRHELQAQRQLIAQQLKPAPTVISGYPRSMVMRFFTRRPEVVSSLLAEFATLLLGARLIKSMISVMSSARSSRSTLTRMK